MTQSATLNDLFDGLSTRGRGAYGLSDVTQLEHALQTAALAREAGFSDAMIIAALFHDVGHMFESDEDVDLASQGIDDKHEDSSANLLAPIFGETVSEPVRLHVASKRYLCAVDPTYFEALAPDSVTSLKLQGGPMSDREVAEFEANPHFNEGVALRRLDDQAKVSGLGTPTLESYRDLAERVASSNQ